MIETSEFKIVIENIISEIQATQLKIFQNANEKILELYFCIGKIIDENISWGNKFVDELSVELKIKFPLAKGYSPRNLRNMRKYYVSVKNNKELKNLSHKIPWSHNILIMDRVMII